MLVRVSVSVNDRAELGQPVLERLQVILSVDAGFIEVGQELADGGELAVGGRALLVLADGEEEEGEELHDVVERGVHSVWLGRGTGVVFLPGGVELGDELDNLGVDGLYVIGLDVLGPVLLKGGEPVPYIDERFKDR